MASLSNSLDLISNPLLSNSFWIDPKSSNLAVILISFSDLLKSIITDIINPNIIKLVSSLSLISPLAIKYPFVFDIVKGFSNVLWLFIIWLITIFVSFFVIEYILNRKVIGLTSNVQDDEKKQFIKEKIISKEYNNILPNEKDKIEMIDNGTKATFDGPFTLPILRRNEAMIKIKWN